MKERDRIPPNVPDERELIDRATMLLGERAKGNLKQSLQNELAQLLGRAPRDPEQAAAWKYALKQIRKDEIFSASD